MIDFNEAKPFKIEEWKGKDLLGFDLMMVRDELSSYGSLRMK